MTKLNKAVPFILPIAVWLAAGVSKILVALLFQMLFAIVDDVGWAWSVLAYAIVNGALQIAIVCVLTVIAYKKFGFRFKGLAITLPLMFALYAVYHTPGLYIFAFTVEWSFFGHSHQINRLLAAFWITLQFGIVMLFTLMAVYNKSKSAAPKE